MPFYGEEDPIKEYNERLSSRFVHEGYKYKISEEKLVNALARTNSVKDAAKFLGISYKTMKKYCLMYVDDATGKTLFDKYKRAKGKGVKKIIRHSATHISKYPIYVFRKHKKATQTRIEKLKDMLQEGQWVPLECEICKFNNRRLADLRSPLILNFKNDDPSDWRIHNIRFLCYNCYFLFVTDPISKDTIIRLESEGVNYEFLTDKPQQKIDRAKQVNEIFNRHLEIIGVHDASKNSEDEHTISKNIKREDELPDDLVNYL